MSEAGNGLRLYNTLTRTKEAFAPIDPKNVRMYVCGPTVYDFAHIGNARPVIVFDVLFRLLRHLYGAEHVNYVRNITDVDDKINARAARDYPNLPLNEAIRIVTEETNAQFQSDVSALGCLPPTSQPRATEHIEEMRALIERLVKNGVAYVAEDHVLFSPKRMNARVKSPRYGALARRSLDEMLAGARVDVASYKEDDMDFVLWKPSKPGEPGWPSPAGISGLGRPGWHIECSAMSMAKLLEPYGGGLQCDDPEKNVFDIHAGGIDLVFPHHENEIAQSCCAFGSERMANIWMHNGFLQVEGKKMAKSEGNFVTINELLNTEKFGGRKWPGEVLRLAMLMTHYRKPIDFSVSKLVEAEDMLRRWGQALLEISDPELIGQFSVSPIVDDEVKYYLSNDINTPMVITRLNKLASSRRERSEHWASEFIGGLEVLGFVPSTIALLNSMDDLFARLRDLDVEKSYLREVFKDLLQDRKFQEFSALSSDQESEIKDIAIEAFVDWQIDQRLALIREKNWAEADKIRDELLAQGIQLKDGKDPVTGERVTTWEVKR